MQARSGENLDVAEFLDCLKFLYLLLGPTQLDTNNYEHFSLDLPLSEVSAAS